MTSMRLLVLLGSLSVVSAAFATTYVRVEKDGSKTYSDRPCEGCTPVDLQPAQTYSAPAQPQPASSSSPSAPAAEFKYQGCGVLPANDAQIMSPESVPISVQITPALRAGDTLTLSVDGTVLGANTTSYVLKPADRGEHTVQLTIKDPDGRTVCSARSVFHVFQPSIQNPQRQRRGG